MPTDIYPIQYGEEQCEYNHSFGPCMRNNYILHYVYSGRGTLEMNGQIYKLKKRKMFLIPPNCLAVYKADAKEPWFYRWIEFNGSMSAEILKKAGLSINRPIFNEHGTTAAADALKEIVMGGDMEFAVLMQKFWKFISTVSHEKREKELPIGEQYVRQSEVYMKSFIHEKTDIGKVAEYIGIDRSYYCRLFRKYRGITPQEYMLTLKMNAAAQLLRNKNLKISEVAQSVGYEDYRTFDKAFSNHFNMYPAKWRKQNEWEQSIVQEKD